tara:strand:+ start:122 stop:721 length:600 start_codon:yes stop_codon:yes gene_type:complete
MTEIKAFDRWSTEGIEITDPGLKPYICIEPKVVPRTNARHIGNRFHKSKLFIVERLINKVMVPGHKGKDHFKSSGHITGKAHKAYDIVEKALSLVEVRTKLNPIKVLVKAIENGSPREEIITIEYGGARYPKAVEVAPQRRVDLVLIHITQGSYQKSFNTKKAIEECLAEEIINAYKSNPASVIISKKKDMERQADSSR